MLKTTGGRVRVALCIFLALIVVLGLSAPTTGNAAGIDTGWQPLATGGYSGDLPQSVIADATTLATQLYGNSRRSQEYVDDLLATYAESLDSDILILFNPGGWGYQPPRDMDSGWGSIMAELQRGLTESDSNPLILTYQRTVRNAQGFLGELTDMFRGYSAKARALASRVEFLTEHNPDLKVVITGESMGTMISSQAMKLLDDNPQVFCIITGPPFWNRTDSSDRSLVIRDNGVVPDSFSRGDLWKMFCANLASLFQLPRDDAEEGEILHVFQAPGHLYSWTFPGVSKQIVAFFTETIGVELSGLLPEE